MTTTNNDTITDEQIRGLCDAAGCAGDVAQVKLCVAALRGDDKARAECAKVIRAALAMEDM